MIQRVQSILLLVVVLCMAALFFVPVWHKQNTNLNEQATLTAYTLEHTRTGSAITTQPAWYVALLAGFVAGVAGFSLFQYRNRLLQMKLGALISLLSAGLLLAIGLLMREGESLFSPSIRGEYQAGVYLPLVAVIANMFATRFIRRDEQLVRSSDRIR